MKNEVMDQLLSLKEQELDELREVSKRYVPNSLYAYEKVGDFERPEFEMEREFFDIQREVRKIDFVIDDPLNSEMKKLFDAGDGKISDRERLYQLFKREGGSSSFDLIGHFFPEEYGIRTVPEILCTAGCSILHYLMGLLSPVHAVLYEKQENLDLGIVILKKPMVKGLYEPEVAYNVHLEVSKDEEGEVKYIHIHNSEFPRSFKPNRHCLI